MIKRIKNIKQNLKNIKPNFVEMKKDLQYIRLALGRIENRQINKIYSTEFKVFSQWGEDGIIQYLLNNIKIDKKIFIEFGVENYTESNTRFLLINNNWSGLVLDGNQENINFIKHDEIYWKYNLKAEYAFITAENINNIFEKNGISGEIGILSIDIDGNDFWVWKAIKNVNPAIVICEYNYRFGEERAVTIPYRADFIRSKAHYSNLYGGASIKALTLLAKNKGYSLVAGNENGNNVFFVRNDLLNDVITEKDISDIYRVGQFRESRNKKGELTFLSFEEELKLIKDLKLIDVEDMFK